MQWDLPLFRRSVYLLALLHLSPLWADEVTLLCDDQAALDSRVRIIQTSITSLDISWFELDDDKIGQHFTLAIADAAKRGVSVRLILDGMFDRTSTHQRELLKDSGVKIKWFHPTGTGATNLMERMHDKYICADQTHLIVGSRNISNVYFGVSKRETNFRDYDVMISGDFPRSTNQYFESLWTGDEVDSLRTYKPSAKLLHHSTRQFDAPLEQTKTDPTAPMQFEIPSDCISFVHDAEARKDANAGIHKDLYKLLNQATERIDIIAPYFFPSRECASVLKQAEQRGVEIRILTNSLETTNRPINHVALMTQMRHRLGTLPIYQYTGERTLHAKGLIIDEGTACITSYNFNRRSEFFDTELALIIRDKQFTSALADQFSIYFEQSKPLPILPRREVGIGSEYTTDDIRQLRWLARLIPNHL